MSPSLRNSTNFSRSNVECANQPYQEKKVTAGEVVGGCGEEVSEGGGESTTVGSREG